MSVNKVHLLGNVGNEIQVKEFEGGGKVGNMPLATNSSYKSKQTGERITDTQWHNLVFRNKLVDVIEKYVKKGDQIYVEGEIRNRKWQDKEGNDRYTTEINVREFSFVGSKSSSGASKPDNEPRQSGENEENEHDDLPF